MNFPEELRSLLAAQVPLLHLVTYEEERVFETLMSLRGDGIENLGITSWDIADGFTNHRKGAHEFPSKDCTTDSILMHVAEKIPENHILVLKDFHHSWLAKRGYITRKLRNLIPRLRAGRRCLVMLTPPLPSEQGLPRELKHEAVSLDVPMPDYAGIGGLFDDFSRRLDRSLLPRPELRHKLVESALGLSTPQARLAFMRTYSALGRFDERAVAHITAAKQQTIREVGALEFWPPSAQEGDVGGLDLLKSWLKLRELGFSPLARSSNLPYPKSVALIGIPGTGKSLTAKMTANLWKLPLLRLDVGAIYSSLLGEAEANMRRSIQLAETVSPCILWVDEMEKAFAGAGESNGNGARQSVFGTFLIWMRECNKPVFVVTTANDISGLPAEFLNGFDATFFLDLPNPLERRAIFTIHLKRARVDFPERKYRMVELVEASKGMVGREIARAVVEAQFTAFADGNREIEQEDIIQSLKATVPLSRSHEAVVENLRRWKTEGRARPASSDEPQPATGSRARAVDA